MLNGLARSIVRFGRARRGVAAVEFAMVAPVLVLMLGGVVELGGAITASNRSTYVADALAEMVSRVDHKITSDEMRNYIVSASLVNPDIIRYAAKSGTAIEQAFKVTVSSVQFNKKTASCTSNCVYEAKVVFSYSMNGAPRACGTLTPAAGSGQTSTTLPTEVFGPGTLVVVDVETFFSPLMTARLPVTVSFKRSAYFRPRSVSRIDYQTNCSGF
ncbi:MAG: TadE/TadG family type IV pilus assembly protein [Hansschlegelia sp.]